MKTGKIEGNSIYGKIVNVMKEVQYIQKKGFNTHFRYKYATEADVNEKIREEFCKQNVVMTPDIVHSEIREHVNRSGNTEYITKVDMEFTFVDADTGDYFVICSSGEGQDTGDKGIYKAIAGAQKYVLMKLFMIPTGDDPEADESVDERNTTPAPAGNNVVTQQPMKPQSPPKTNPSPANSTTSTPPPQPPTPPAPPEQKVVAKMATETQQEVVSKTIAMMNKRGKDLTVEGFLQENFNKTSLDSLSFNEGIEAVKKCNELISS